MKKSLLILSTVALAFGFTSCSEECCDCGEIANQPGVTIDGPSEICESDVEDEGEDWGQAKSGFTSIGCDCD